jgi:proline dehydrogenase
MTVKIRKLLWSVIGSLARKASNQYIAGPELDDAQRVCNYLSGLGYGVTQGYWNSADDEPADVLGIYQASLDWLARLEGKNYLSIKVPSLHFDSGLFGNLLARSHLLKVPVLFDSLAPEQTDRTLELIRSAAEAPFADIGCTLPGRWRRSVVDADLANELGLNVRVVKGQWKDPDYPDSNPRSGYLQVIERLAGKSRCVRVATHDLSLARDALGVLVASNTCCELELLYGLPTGKLIALAAEFGVPVRFYVAFGYAYLPYALSDLTKHPKMILPFMREVLKGNYLSTIPDFSEIKRNCGK